MADGRTFLQQSLSEKIVASEAGRDGAPDEVGSFSRVAGAFGAIALAAAMIRVSYWLVYALFYKEDLTVLKNAGWFFLSGSSLFAPYAFNQLSSIFKIPRCTQRSTRNS